MQLVTVGELLEGKTLDYPRTVVINQTFKKAPRVREAPERVPELFDEDAGD